MPRLSREEPVKVLCVFCEQPIDSEDRRTYRRVEGWEKPRSQGGANQITLRQSGDDHACSDCIDEIRAGRHPLQAELFA